MEPENGPLEKEIPIGENHQDLGVYLGLRGFKLVVPICVIYTYWLIYQVAIHTTNLHLNPDTFWLVS